MVFMNYTENLIKSILLDNVEIDALSHALQLNLDLAYLNGVREDGVDFIPFRNAINKDDAQLVLLYRCVSQSPFLSLALYAPILFVSASLASLMLSLPVRGSPLMLTPYILSYILPLRNLIRIYINLRSCPYRPGHYDILVKQ